MTTVNAKAAILGADAPAYDPRRALRGSAGRVRPRRCFGGCGQFLVKPLVFVQAILAIAAAPSLGADLSVNAAEGNGIVAGVGLGEPSPVIEWVDEPDLMFISEDALWARVLQSSLIVVADVDVSSIPENIPQKEFLSIPILVRDVLKGSTDETNLVLKIWPEHQKPMAALKTTSPTNAEDRLRLLFVSVEEGGECYLDDSFDNRIQRADEDVLNAAKREIAAQNRALEAFGDFVRPDTLPHWEAVSNAVAELTLDSRKQSASVDRILGFGLEAVPALVVLMDDRRELPDKSLSLSNSGSNHWEAFRHYGPKTVLDLIDALADHATKIGFGSVVNGGTERERRLAVARWKLLLLRWLDENRKSGRFLRPRLLGS